MADLTEGLGRPRPSRWLFATELVDGVAVEHALNTRYIVTGEPEGVDAVRVNLTNGSSRVLAMTIGELTRFLRERP